MQPLTIALISLAILAVAYLIYKYMNRPKPQNNVCVASMVALQKEYVGIASHLLSWWNTFLDQNGLNTSTIAMDNHFGEYLKNVITVARQATNSCAAAQQMQRELLAASQKATQTQHGHAFDVLLDSHHTAEYHDFIQFYNILLNYQQRLAIFKPPSMLM